MNKKEKIHMACALLRTLHLSCQPVLLGQCAMKTHRLFCSVAAALCGMAWSPQASAALCNLVGANLTICAGTDTAPNRTVTVTADPYLARQAWKGFLDSSSIRIESFTGITDQTPVGTGLPGETPGVDLYFPSPLPAPSAPLATLTADEANGLPGGYVLTVGTIGVGSNGRFGTTTGGDSDMILETRANFAIEFTSAISAFGFYITDAGDFGGGLSARLFYESVGGAIQPEIVQINPSGSTIADGALQFWGFVETSRKVTRIELLTSTQDDGIGFDDLSIGSLATQPPVVPEPGTILLGGLALLGLRVSRRKVQ